MAEDRFGAQGKIKYMKTFIETVRVALKDSNYYAGLFVVLTLPDICGKLEDPESNNSSQRYTKWFDKYMVQYDGFLSGNDCYALRCALLHAGSADITTQRKREVLEYVLFLEEGPHRNLLENCTFNGVKKTFLQLNVQMFCEDICRGVEAWLDNMAGDAGIETRMQEGIVIHPKGFIHRGVQFG